MNKTYNHTEQEERIYKMWEEANAFSPEGAQKLREGENIEILDTPFSILMPPPNANAALHCGHAEFAGIEDLVTRFKRMQGYKTLYLPGTDHAGFETQYVFEKKLQKEEKSRFDFDRKTFFNLVLDFVKENSNIAIDQLKRLGVSADWSRNTFMLDKKVTDRVFSTFEKMYKDGLVYRDGYMVNYSTFHGTTFSDLETDYKETVSPLYYVKYFIKDSNTFITVATVRPETIYADVAIAVNPEDSKYKEFIGKIAINPLNRRELPIITDAYVDPEFGTGALKITPGHDPNDFLIGKKNNLEVISIIGLDGKMFNTEAGIDGLYPKQARTKVAEILEKKGALEKIDENYSNRILVDYKDGMPIEPLVLPNWFIKTDTLFKSVIDAVEKEEVRFNRKLWKNEILRWLREKKPWPISRQIVFGIRIPVWYKIAENSNLQVTFIDKNGISRTGNISAILETNNGNEYSLQEIKDGLQKVIAPIDVEFVVSYSEPGEEYIQETDTFDTWFSSGQWPLTTLEYPDSDDYKTYYPTSLMETGWDIIFFWVARMLMFGLYLDSGHRVPFKHVYIHGMVTDKFGKKMSKSKGNAVNPLEFVEKYGADALRMGILVGGNTSARTTPLDEDKVRGYRNFANKIWNIGRFLDLQLNDSKLSNLSFNLSEMSLKEEDTAIISTLNALIDKTTNYLENYKFKYAGEVLYHFVWEDLASTYLEKVKNREDKETVLSVLLYIYSTSLKLLHPFMPFVTEAIWQEMQLGNLDIEGNHSLLIVSKWPSIRKV